MKKCTACEETDLSKFNKDKAASDGLRSMCRSCTYFRRKERQKINRINKRKKNIDEGYLYHQEIMMLKDKEQREFRLRMAKKLKMLRMEKGFTQNDLAEYVGQSRISINRYENAVQVPSLQALFFLATAFEITLDDLVKGVLK